MNSLTVNLHLMLASFYRPQGQRTRILIEAGAFSSDRHAVASQIAWQGLDARDVLVELAPEPGAELLTEEQHRELPGAARSRASRWCCGRACSTAPARPSTCRASRAPRTAHGCIAGFDLAHSIGNMPLRCMTRTPISPSGAATST